MTAEGIYNVGSATPHELAERVLSGDEKSAARLISLVEADKEAGYEALSELYPHTGKAHIIGITGSPGVGKSSLAGKLAVSFAEAGKRVGVVAVDPSSAKRTGGALLGDRVRMKDAEKLKSVFIRSMANRAHPGGLAKAAAGAVYVLEALGKDTVLVESVGAGQSEKALTYLADTIVTVFTPDFGDEIQLLKAGLVEIGDIVVQNKSDSPNAEAAGRLLTAYLEQAGGGEGWRVPMFLCRADKGLGVAEVAAAVEDHLAFLGREGKGSADKREKRFQFTLMLVKEELMAKFLKKNEGLSSYAQWEQAVREGRLDPYAAARQITDNL